MEAPQPVSVDTVPGKKTWAEWLETFDPAPLSEDSAEERTTRLKLSFAVFGTALFFYTLTVCPSAPPGDSSEMISSAYTLGVPHPPGTFCTVEFFFIF